MGALLTSSPKSIFIMKRTLRKSSSGDDSSANDSAVPMDFCA